MTAAKPRTAPPRRLARRVLLTLVGVAVLGAVAHGLAWRWATGALAVGFADWAALRRVQGWTVEHGPPARTGWPLAAELALPALTVEARDPAGRTVRLDSTRLVLRLAPPRPDRLVVRAEGPQRLVLGGLAVPFAADRLEVIVPLEPGAPPRMAELVVEGLRAETPDGPLTAGRASLSVAAAAEPPLRIRAEATALTLPPRANARAYAAFGRDVARIAVEAAFAGPPPQGTGAGALRAWRESGGMLELDSVGLRWGAFDGQARLALGLDPALQPVGDGTLRLADPAAALAALEGAGLVADGAARTARGILPLMLRQPAQGGAPEVDLPVAIGQGRISMARIPLLRFAPIAWSEGPAPAAPMRR